MPKSMTYAEGILISADGRRLFEQAAKIAEIEMGTYRELCIDAAGRVASSNEMAYNIRQSAYNRRQRAYLVMAPFRAMFQEKAATMRRVLGSTRVSIVPEVQG